MLAMAGTEPNPTTEVPAAVSSPAVTPTPSVLALAALCARPSPAQPATVPKSAPRRAASAADAIGAAASEDAPVRLRFPGVTPRKGPRVARAPPQARIPAPAGLIAAAARLRQRQERESARAAQTAAEAAAVLVADAQEVGAAIVDAAEAQAAEIVQLANARAAEAVVEPDYEELDARLRAAEARLQEYKAEQQPQADSASDV